jgi:hypothetical protein
MVNKYGQFFENIKVQHSLGNTQYPHTIEEAHAVLSVQKIEKSTKPKSEKKKPPSRELRESKIPAKSEEETELSFAQMEGMCYCCGKKGHKSPDCRHKDKPKSEWAIHKATQKSQHVMSTSAASSTAEAVPATASSTVVVFAIQHYLKRVA